MIFDSKQMASLRTEYASKTDIQAPKVVFLDRSPELQREREYLEQVITSVPEAKRKDLLGRFLSRDDASHLGAWFELFLFGWLQKAGTGSVTIEPLLEGDLPDFVVDTGAYLIPVEARVVKTSYHEKERKDTVAQICHWLSTITRPYLLTVKSLEIKVLPEPSHLLSQVTSWIDTNPDNPFGYTDPLGNQMTLRAEYSSQLNHCFVMGPAEWFSVKSEPLQRPIREKAKQHRRIRNANHPYIIALLLESLMLSSEEVVEAWFGKVEYLYEPDTMQLLGSHTDMSGIHFWKGEIRHKSVSGTLVFRKVFDARLGRHTLRPWYIQNPYASTEIPTNLFPVESKFVVVDRDAQSYKMSWIS